MNWTYTLYKTEWGSQEWTIQKHKQHFEKAQNENKQKKYPKENCKIRTRTQP